MDASMDMGGSFFNTGPFMPHGGCYLWTTSLILLHSLSDGAIVLSYYFIPFILLYFVRKRQDLKFKWIFVLFAAFVLACGTTHLMEIWNIWHANYWLSGFVKAITALVSVAATILLVKLMPHALALPSTEDLRKARDELEIRVKERTAELEHTTRDLQAQIVERRRAEESLSYLAAIVESSDDAIIGKDLNGIVTSWNQGAEKIFGYTAGEMVGTSIRRLIPASQEDEEDQILARIKRGEKMDHFETVRQTKDGRLMDVSITASAIKDAAGRIIGVSKVARDITQLKEREREVIRLSRLYAALSQINQAIVWVPERDAMLEKICRVLVEDGGFRMAWIGQPDAKTQRVNPVAKWGDSMDYLSQAVIYADDRPEGRGPTGTAIREGKSYICNDFAGDPNTLPWHEPANRASFRSSATFPIRQGGVIWGALTIYSDGIGFFRDQEIALLEEAATDISFALDNLAREESRRQAEAALRASEQEFRTLAEAMPQIVWMTRPDGWNIYFNQQWVDYTGLTMEESHGHGWNKPFHPDDRERAWDAWQAATTKLAEYSIECRLRRADGEYRWWLIRGVPLRSAAGNVLKWFGTCTDIHERKLADEAVLRSQAEFKDLFDNAPVGFHEFDAEGRLVRINHTQLEMQGYTAGELLGQFVWTLSADEKTTRKNVLALLRGDRPPPQNIERMFRRKDGSTFPVVINARLLQRENGVITGVRSAVQDITEKIQTEKALNRERDLLRVLLDHSPDKIYFKDLQSRFVKASKAMAIQFGAESPEAMVGKTDFDFFSEAHARPAYEDEQEILRTGQAIVDKEEREEWKDGRVTWATSTKLPWLDDTGKIIGIIGISRDITERKRIEQGLHESEERFAAAFHASPNLITITRMADGTIVEINEGFTHLLGYSRNESIGQTTAGLSIWVNPADRATFSGTLEKFGEITNFETTLRRKDGNVVTVLVSAKTIELQSEMCILSVALDITERKQTEEALRRAGIYNRSLIEANLDPLVTIGPHGKITDVNSATEKATGCERAELIGTDFSDYFTEPEKARAGYQRVFDDGFVRDYPLELRHRDGHITSVLYNASIYRDATGNVAGVFAAARDITERRKLEDQLRQSQKLEAFGQLAGGVAHDFNNILAVIQLQAGLLKAEKGLSSEQLDYARDIELAAQRGANLTHQLLLFSRKQIMQPQNLKLKEVVDNMAKMLRRTLGEQVELQFKYAPETLFIHADPGMIDQILLNLTVNARDAMPKGGQIIIETSAAEFDEVTATHSPLARPGSFACLTVSDTGSGISPEILPRIFEPFFTTKEVGKGTGLGLATVFGIVQQHQGWINVYSEVGRGTTFQVYLPRAAKTSDTEFFWSAAASLRGGKESILLVEDEGALRAVVRTALSRLGYRVLEAANGAAALTVWQQHRDEIQLLLTDLVMPGGMTGKEVAQTLLQENPKLQVIYASGYSVEVAGKDLLLEEGVNFLAKPFQTHKLAHIIRKRLDQD